MKDFDREVVKTLILLCFTVEEADKIISEQTEFETYKEKMAFLKGMFGCPRIFEHEGDSDELIYTLMLQGIISQKNY